MIGLGVGIDYALFILTRFRNGLDEGLEPRDAAIAASRLRGVEWADRTSQTKSVNGSRGGVGSAP